MSQGSQDFGISWHQMSRSARFRVRKQEASFVASAFLSVLLTLGMSAGDGRFTVHFAPETGIANRSVSELDRNLDGLGRSAADQ